MGTILAEDLADLAPAELAELCEVFADGELGELAATELERREQARRDRGQARRDAVRAEWHELAYSDYLAAEAECRGELVNRAGVAAGVRDGFALWSGPRAIAERYATDELLEWWLTHPRVTVGEYSAQRARAARIARLDYREQATDAADDFTADDFTTTTTTEVNDGHDTADQHERADLGTDEPVGLRHLGTADTVRPGRDGQLNGGAEAGRVRHPRPVHPVRLTSAQSGPGRRGDLAARRAAKAGRAVPVAPRTAPAAGRPVIVWTAEVTTAEGSRTLARGVADPKVAMQACAASPESVALGMAGVRLSFGQQTPARWTAGARGVQFVITAEQAGRVPA